MSIWEAQVDVHVPSLGQPTSTAWQMPSGGADMRVRPTRASTSDVDCKPSRLFRGKIQDIWVKMWELLRIHPMLSLRRT